MDGRDAFIAAIIAAPDDDLPRLVFADWLEEQGEADRAEFIRVQVELVNTPPPDGPDRCVYCDDGYCGCWCRHCVLRERERALFCSEWNEELGGHSDTDYPPPVWRRGFVDSLTRPAAAWLAHGDELCRLHPIRQVRLTTWPEYSSDFPTNGVLLRAGRDVYRCKRAEDGCWYGKNGPAVKHVLGDEWPGVAFELPPEPVTLEARRLFSQVRVSEELLRESEAVANATGLNAALRQARTEVMGYADDDPPPTS